MLAKLVFAFMLMKGTVVPQGEHEGRKMYAVIMSDSTAVDYAYKGEVLNYIKTKEFKYNEDLK
jgi:hypothetical protein